MRPREPRRRRGERTPTAAYPRRPGYCTWCQKAVKPPKVTWCGDPQCVHEYQMATDQGYRRAHVYQRDLGVCARCKKDCHAAAERLRALRDDAARAWRALAPGAEAAAQAFVAAAVEEGLTRAQAAKVLELRGPGTAIVSSLPSLWQADHVIPLAERGGNGLSNLQTCCLPCHKAKTERQAARRRASSATRK